MRWKRTAELPLHGIFCNWYMHLGSPSPAPSAVDSQRHRHLTHAVPPASVLDRPQRQSRWMGGQEEGWSCPSRKPFSTCEECNGGTGLAGGSNAVLTYRRKCIRSGCRSQGMMSEARARQTQPGQRSSRVVHYSCFMYCVLTS